MKTLENRRYTVSQKRPLFIFWIIQRI